jgi:hypothetical protein
MSDTNNVNNNFETSEKNTNPQYEINKYLKALSEFYPSPDERKDYSKYSLIGKLLFSAKIALNGFPFFKKTNLYRETGITNWSISAEVHDRLLLRHTILNKLEKFEGAYEAHQDLVKIYTETKKPPEPKKLSTLGKFDVFQSKKEQSQQYEIENPHLRAYRLAATDLFVEKAIAYLEIDCNRYTKRGMTLFAIGIVFVFIGIITSGINTFECGTDFTAALIGGDHCKIIAKSSEELFKHHVKYYWVELVSKFTRGFTFYGMIVLLSVGCWRLGKAMLDQAERLRERRHSLRQGRLFIHLNNGNVTIEQLEKAFDWNVSKGNAFANIETEASAPWGAVLKEAVKILPEVFRRAKDAPAK